ncbi:hypothetical protein AYO40_04935 [Planctomycetaceae bacterium SCGC AG-212-D15]|nr:hypothetical protein AYO40_04935 [Planctomycetaceae bacterium SCGC AG-212-D15]
MTKPLTNEEAADKWQEWNAGWFHWFRFGMAMLAFVLIAVTVYRISTHEHYCSWEPLTYCIFWAIVPPLYFFVEYWAFFPDDLKNNKDINSIFKNGQDTGRNIWAGVAVFVLLTFRTAFQQPSDDHKKLVEQVEKQQKQLNEQAEEIKLLKGQAP